MNKLFIFLFMFFVSFSAFSDTYTDLAGASQMVADSFDDLWTFFFTDTPNMIERAMAYLLQKFLEVKLYAYAEFLKLAYNMAKVMIENLNVMSTITNQMSLLPQDIQQAIVQSRLIDGFNILIQARLTKFIMGLSS